MKKKKYIKLRIENTLTAFIMVLVVVTLVFSFIFKAEIQSYNSELQRLKSKIQTQEQMNASIQMKINELSSLDNALEVADTFGLEYNNSNIRVVSK